MVYRELPSNICFDGGSRDVQDTHARCLSILRGVDPHVREDKVEAIKAQIKSGTYESDEKLDIAADRLLDDLKM